MEKLILQCKVNGELQIEAKLQTLLDEFVSLNEEKSVSNKFEELLILTLRSLQPVVRWM